MGQLPQPRFADPEVFRDYLSAAGDSTRSQNVLASILASAETMVERYCRRRFAPEPALADPDTGYQRQVLSISGQAGALSAGGTPAVGGTITATWGGQNVQLTLPVTSAALQSALTGLSSIGVGQVACAGGPLPAWPISITWAGALSGAQPVISVDSSALVGGYAWVEDMGFDSAPPVLKRFTSRGRTTIRVPDLRLVDAAPDPRVPNSGGMVLYGRRLLPNQYYLGADAYSPGGADEAIGTGDYAEPSTEVILGYGAETGYSLAAQFSYVLPLGYMANDLAITGRWGWNPVPPGILDAVYSVGARRYRERDAAFSDQLVTQEGVVFQFFKQMPASVQATLDTYRVPNIALLG